jgi:tRNA(Glu) U13 pseudouridine synthase TruD
MEHTSRLRVLDAVELIANQIAIGSHCQELINEYMSDYELEQTDELRQKIIDQQNLLSQSITMRRMVMENLLETFESSDKNLRCTFKHAVASYMFATECAQAATAICRGDIQRRAYLQMIQVLSMFLGVEVQVCGRCLQDILSGKQSKNVRMMQQKESSDDGQT